MNAVARHAALRLLGGTAAWGLSFPTAKAIMLMQAGLVPGKPEWFHAALVLCNRMFLASLIMAVLYRRKLREIGRPEVRQGIALGVLGGGGMLLQTDAQNYISASTSAFFTQFTCVFVPLLVAWRLRQWPGWRVVVATSLVMIGCALLNGGVRGEWETILAAVFFTGQILALERDSFRDNEMRSVAAAMFATKALFFLPVVLFGLFVSGGEGEVGHVNRTPVFFTIYTSGAVWIATAILTLFSTVYGYATMTRWQPCVSSVQAGLIYATEPVFATLWALFLPGAYSAIGAIHYPNEQLGAGFLWGAGLVMAANALLLFQHGSGHAAQPPRPCVESR